MRSKKGDITLMTIAEIVAGVALAYLLVLVVKERATGEIYDKVFLSRDLALMVDAIETVPANIFYGYTSDWTYSFAFKNNQVSVYTRTMDELGRADYPYASSNSKIDFLFTKPIYLIFSKTGDELRISGSDPPETKELLNQRLNKMQCPRTDANEKIGGKTALIDPGYSFALAPEATRQLEIIAKTIQSRNTAFKEIAILENPQYGKQLREAIDEKNPDVLIFLRTAASTNPNNLKIFTQDDVRQAKLGCLIINSILDKKELGGIEGATTVSTDTEQGIAENKGAIIIELGNADAEKNSLLKQAQYSGEAIYEGLMAYTK